MIRPIVGWGLMMCALATIGATVFSYPAPHAPALLYGIGGFMVVLGLVLLVTGLGRNVEYPRVTAPDVSPPTTLAGLGFVVIALGSVAGLWAVWVGGGIVLVGLGGLVREWRAQR